MTTSEDEFVCENCAQSFPIHLTTIVQTKSGSREGSARELTFHDPQCAEEHAARGGPRSPEDA